MSLKFRIKQLFFLITNSKIYYDLLNNYFHIAMIIVLFLFTINDLVFGLILILYEVFVYKKAKSCFYTALIICLFILINYFIIDTKGQLKQPDISGRIDLISKREYSNRLLIKTKKGKVYVYDYEFLDLEVGMIIEAKGEIIPLKPIRIEGEFNYFRYLKQNKIIGSLKADSIEVVGKKYSSYWIVQKVNEKIEKTFDGSTSIFIKALILGDDSGFNDDFKDSLIVNGTLHLFAISGSHISLFVILLGALISKFTKKTRIAEVVICVFLLFYMTITSFSPSIVRAALMYYLVIINKRLKLRLSTVDNVSLVFIFLIAINPFYMYNVGFVLSFLVSFMIILVNPIIKEMNSLKQALVICTLSQLIALPLTINLNYEVNLLSPFINIFSIFLVETVILPITLVVFFIPIGQSIYKIIIDGFMSISIFTSKIINIPIRFPFFNSITIIIFYIILLLLCLYKNKRRAYLILLMFLLCLSNIRYFQFNGEINYLDLHNGESIIILEPNNNCNMVIDTGDGSNSAVTNFLKRKGVKKIDALVLTHNHVDHNGEAIEILKNFIITNVYINAYDNSSLGLFNNVTRVCMGDRIDCGNLTFNVLNPSSNSNDENDNSIVLYGEIGGLKHLFLGDSTKNIEMKFSNLKVDVVKIAHHGSKTSTSLSFITKLNPQYAIIQTGHVEKFGFPHTEVINNLMNINNVYRTDINGSIKFKYIKNKHIYKTLR